MVPRILSSQKSWFTKHLAHLDAWSIVNTSPINDFFLNIGNGNLYAQSRLNPIPGVADVNECAEPELHDCDPNAARFVFIHFFKLKTFYF